MRFSTTAAHTCEIRFTVNGVVRFSFTAKIVSRAESAPSAFAVRLLGTANRLSAYRSVRDVSVFAPPTGREDVYAAIAIISSLVSFSTTGFINSVH